MACYIREEKNEGGRQGWKHITFLLPTLEKFNIQTNAHTQRERDRNRDRDRYRELAIEQNKTKPTPS